MAELSPAREHELGASFRSSGFAPADPIVGRMAHELRNVLQIISGRLALLSRRVGEDEAASRHVVRAMAGVDLGRRLTGDAIEHGRNASTHPSTSIVEGHAALDCMLAEAAGPKVTVRLAISRGLREVAATRSEIENVLIDLVINASHAMDGCGIVNVAFENGWVAGSHWVDLTVTDTGCGMLPDVIERTFEPFFSTKSGAGAGLGLATVRRFVEDCGGSVRIESTVGVGTAVRIRIPATSND